MVRAPPVELLLPLFYLYKVCFFVFLFFVFLPGMGNCHLPRDFSSTVELPTLDAQVRGSSPDFALLYCRTWWVGG